MGPASVEYTIVTSPLGAMLVARTDRGVCRVAFADADAAGDLEWLLAREHPDGVVTRDDDALAPVVTELLHRIGGGAPELELPIDVTGTEFQCDVWREMQRIPRGETATYGEVAAAVGRPGGARAVGQACGRNPVAVVVPCHRVVAAGGLGGFGWGPDRKRALLAAEGAPVVR